MQNRVTRPRYQGRVLVLDDLEQWRDALTEILQRDGYIVDAVATSTELFSLLEETFYHIVILDICLNEGDQSNIEGWKILHQIDKLKFDGALKIVMVSAHGTKEQMRNAFHDYKVGDFIIKSSFDHREFKDSIRKIFVEDLQINMQLDIIWQHRDPATAVLSLQLMGEEPIERGSALHKRAEIELNDLLRRLFNKAERLLVKPMQPGHSGTAVLLAQPFYINNGAGRTFIIKFGRHDAILQEYENFKNYVEPYIGGKRCTSVLASCRTPLLGGIRYSLLGASGEQPEDFGNFYQRASLSQLKRALDRLFGDTCKAWYANAGYLQPYDLTENYLHVFDYTPQQIEQKVRELSSVEISQRQLHFQALPEHKALSNPLPTLGQHFVRTTYICIQHGDLNQHNLLVDRDSYMWLIDFQATGMSHILCDIATLDSMIRYQLLKAEDATLADRLAMEEVLCNMQHFGPADRPVYSFITTNPALAKVYATVMHLRTIAKDLVGQNPDEDFSEYFIGLFYNALNALRFQNLAVTQREHALLCASLLADQLQE